jgi:hypothetical protein
VPTIPSTTYSLLSKSWKRIENDKVFLIVHCCDLVRDS